jgi:LysR family cyn operon transcriptional activator
MNLMTIELRFLRGLVAIARAGTFQAAAHQLHLTQSALSQQMKELGERLGLTLFERQGRRAVLSDAGRDLVERVGPLIEQLDASLLQSSSSVQRVAGRLRLGATQTYLRSIALPAALEMISIHPDLKIDARQLPAQRLLADLLDGEIDVAIFPETGPHNSLSQVTLLSERLAVIGTAAALLKIGKISGLKSLEGHPLALLNRHFLMRQNIDKQARQDKVTLDIRLEVSGMDDLITAITAGRLLAVGSELASLGHSGLVSMKLEGKFLSRSAVLYWRRGRVLTGSLMSFQTIVKRISGELAAAS